MAGVYQKCGTPGKRVDENKKSVKFRIDYLPFGLFESAYLNFEELIPILSSVIFLLTPFWIKFLRVQFFFAADMSLILC